MEIKKKSFLSIITFIVLLFVVAISSAASILGVISETEIVRLREKSFTATAAAEYGSYKYDCFVIDESEHTIAIAWGQDPATTPDDAGGLVLPPTLRKPNTAQDYTVTAIATAGFRYCDFQAITVPNTVTDIGEAAFAYCEQLINFSMPYGITEIKASTFLDCRSLTKITYRDSENNTSMYNYNITSIGDHAFDSCISIVDFNCPSNVTSFGKSCFQNCISLISFSFPQGNATNSNHIIVGSFAFADCSSLISIYFEENMYSIADYAFADCADTLEIDYTGSSIPSFSANWRRRYIATNRNNSSDTNGPSGHLIKVNTLTPIVRKDLRFPGLKYSVVSLGVGERVKLDWGTEDTPITLIAGPIRFAQITGFDAPTAGELAELTSGGSYYYTIAGAVRTLILPDEVKDPDSNEENATLPVLTISGTGFKNKTNSELTSIVFNESLVQINHEVFMGSTGLTSIDFTKCKKLREIGYKAFENCENITAINLPYSLEYIADYAFNRCHKVTNLSFTVNNELFYKDSGTWSSVSGTVIRGVVAPTAGDGADGNYYIDTVKNIAYLKGSGTWTQLSNQSFGINDPTGGNNGDYYIAIPRLKVIGERAFHRVGYTACNKNVYGTVNLVLPESLNDQDAAYASIEHQLDENAEYGDWIVTGGRDHFRDVAVGRHAFDRCTCLATVQMAEAIGDHKTNKDSLDYTCSLGTSAFARCYHLLRFQASDNFYTIGASCFNAETKDGFSFKLKEIFLTSAKACNGLSPFNYPFGIGNSDYPDSNGDAIAVKGAQKDLVIYVNGGIPGDLEHYENYASITNSDQTPNNKSRWNAETKESYPNAFGQNSLGRPEKFLRNNFLFFPRVL